MKQLIRLLMMVGLVMGTFGCGEDKGTNSEDRNTSQGWSPPDYSIIKITNLTGKLAGSTCLGCPLIIFDIANSNHHQLTEDVGSDPSWSSDGKRLVYVSTDTRDPDSDSAIYAADANGSNTMVLVKTGVYPALSPDGKRLAFIKYDGSKQSSNLYLLKFG